MEIIKENPEEILPILLQRVEERLELVEKVKEEFSETTWRKSMDIHYYKALDTKSNYMKVLERKKLINKNLIKELKRQTVVNKKNNNKIQFVNSINNKQIDHELVYMKSNL